MLCFLILNPDFVCFSLSTIANIAKEVADKIFCEATVGSRDKNHSSIVRQLFDRSHFRLRFYPDVEIIEILGAVKNVIAMLAGFGDGLKAGFNTRAAVCHTKRNLLSNFLESVLFVY